MTQQELDNLFMDFKITLSEDEWKQFYNKMKEEILRETNQQPTPIKDVATLNATYPPKEPQTSDYDKVYLIEEGDDAGYLYFFKKDIKEWTKGSIYENSGAVNELRNTKVDVAMLNWGTGLEGVTTKEQFYKEVSKVIVNHPTQSIYMYGTQTELATFFEMWGKPKGLIATHTIISIRPISNTSSRVSFKINMTSSNDRNGDVYELAVSGYNGTYLGNTGWRNLKALEVTEESTMAEPNTLAVRQADGALFAVTNPTPDDMELINAKHLKTYVQDNKTDALDLDKLIEKPIGEYNPLDPTEHTIVTDLNENMDKVEMHLDKTFVDSLSVELKQIPTGRKSGTQAYQFSRIDMMRLKGIRIWIQFPYNGFNALLHEDIYFPVTDSSNPLIDPSYVGTPIPNPFLFSEKIIPIIDTTVGGNTLEVKLLSTGGGIREEIQIYNVIGLI